MARLAILLAAIFLSLSSAPVFAQTLGLKGPTTSDPNDAGYAFDQNSRMFPVEWKKLKAFCPVCEKTADSYNKVMAALMYTRFWIAYIEAEAGPDDKTALWQRQRRTQNNEGADLTADEEKEVAAETDYRLALEDLAGRLPVLKDQQAGLENLAGELQASLGDCTGQMCSGVYGPYFASLKPSGPALFPFDWQGPYKAGCPACAATADALNLIPNDALIVSAGLEEARANLMFAEMEMLAIILARNAILLADGLDDQRTLEMRLQEQLEYDGKTRKRIREMEREKEKTEEHMAGFEFRLDSLQKSFEEKLAGHQTCVRMCAPLDAEPAGVGPRAMDAPDVVEEAGPMMPLEPASQQGSTP